SGSMEVAMAKAQPKSDPAVSYDEFKEYEGRKYTGMKIGRSHKWHYDQGEWKEKNLTVLWWSDLRSGRFLHDPLHFDPHYQCMCTPAVTQR
ncbi:MAG: hypothetical protein ACRENU_00065, partial [Gemmatimonadaceae bacterium]